MEKDLRLYEGAAAALIFFGNVGLMIPYGGAKSGELTAMILAFLISVGLYYLCFKGLDIYKRQKSNKIVLYSVGVILTAFSLYVLTKTSWHFINFVSQDVLIKNHKIFTAFAFLAVCLYAFYKKPEAITKFALPGLVFVVLSVLILFLISFENFNLSHLSPAVIPKSGGFLLRSLKYLYVFFVSPMVFPVFSAFYFKKPSIKTELAGISVGMGFLVICFLSAVLTFSLGQAASLQNAYSKSISVISVGELYTRMEGIGYFVFFFSALVKTVVSAFSVKALLFTMNIKKSREITALLVAGAVLTAFLL